MFLNNRKNTDFGNGVNGPEISNYGVVVPGQDDQSMVGLIEKPSLKDKPSNLASIGRYILIPEIFDVLRNQKPGKGGRFSWQTLLMRWLENNL